MAAPATHADCRADSVGTSSLVRFKDAGRYVAHAGFQTLAVTGTAKMASLQISAAYFIFPSISDVSAGFADLRPRAYIASLICRPARFNPRLSPTARL